MNSMLNERINELKGTFHALWDRMKNTDETSSEENSMDLDYERNFEDDMPLRLAREEGPGVRYTTTENNPLSAGEEKVDSIGIDSFGEDDSIDPEQEKPFTPGI
ncbi:MAG: hypothetical protein V4598_16240 [Bdellovibrionota bacterium]